MNSIQMKTLPANRVLSEAQKQVMKGMRASITARIQAGLDLVTPICIYSFCEANGVTVRFNDINMEGMYDRTPRARIHVSALRPLRRRAFTCAHELGHHVFGHGSTIDELRQESEFVRRNPDETLADAFAAFLLMPTVGLRAAFATRAIVPNSATASELFSIACNFGVGYSTLIKHLTFGIRELSVSRHDRLMRITPKMIKEEFVGATVAESLTIVDQHWNSPTLDMEQQSLVLFPANVVVESTVLGVQTQLKAGRLFKAVRPGICRVTIPGTDWSAYVRVSRRQYVGLAQYRHLEDEGD